MSAATDRLDARFAELKQAGRKGLVTFITAGDPDLPLCADLLAGLPAAGADLIELGMPFSDPMADGPAIQAANIRAFKAGITLQKVLDLVRGFRAKDHVTPLVLMGYFNPIYCYGVERFVTAAKAAGVDALLIVDLPPEEDVELCLPARAAGLHFVRLVTPTTDAARLPLVLKNSSGFLYYVSMTGITGSKQIDIAPLQGAVSAIKAASTLPVVVGFGITTPEQVAAVAQTADAVVVGSAIVQRIAGNLDIAGLPALNLVDDVLGFVRSLKAGLAS